MEKNEELENLVKEIQERTGFEKEVALRLAQYICVRNKDEKYNNLSFDEKLTKAVVIEKLYQIT